MENVNAKQIQSQVNAMTELILAVRTMNSACFSQVEDYEIREKYIELMNCLIDATCKCRELDLLAMRLEEC